MNPIDDQLQRLFRAATPQRQEECAVTPPYGLETRALAAWRTGRASNPGLWDMTLLVRGLLLAIVIMGASFWPVLNTTTDPFSDDLQASDAVLPADATP